MIEPIYKKTICAMLSDSSHLWPENANCSDFLSFAQSQGVLLLLSDQIEQIEEHWPKSVHQAVVIAQAVGVNLLEQRHKVIKLLFEKFSQYHLRAVLFKGAANAYLIYQKPELRQHADIDMLIDINNYNLVTELLTAQGFEIDSIKPTKFGPYQTTATLKQNGKPDVIVDLHWKINNRLLLANTLTLEEVWEDALPIQQYSEQVYGISYKNALLAACIHEAGSLPGERNKLINQYDVHLLVKKIGAQSLGKVLSLASQKGISQICLECLENAITTFGTKQEVQSFKKIAFDYRDIDPEPSALLMKQQRNWFEDQKLDWLAIKGATSKIEYITTKFSRKLLG